MQTKTVGTGGVGREKKLTGIILVSTFARTSRIHPYKMLSTLARKSVCLVRPVTLKTVTPMSVNSNGKTPAALLKDMLFLRESGINIPDDALKYVQWQVWEQAGIKQVWECPCETYESPTKLKAITCKNKKHDMKLSWNV